MDDLDAAVAGLLRGLGGPALQDCTTAAAKLFEQSAKSLVPVDSGQMQAHIETVGSHTQHSATSSVEVADSAKGGNEHAAIFIEYGTQNMTARPFMRPAFESQKANALKTFEQALQRILE